MISVVILTKNEEDNIVDCIHSVEWCDEILIIDDHSTDRTIERINKLNNKKIKILKYHLSNDFSELRNFGLEKASGEWILFIDADERVTDSLQYEILTVINATIDNYSGFLIKRTDNIWGHTFRFGETSKVKLLRLAKKHAGRWKGKVHEKWEVQGKIAEFKNPLIHFPHQNLVLFLQEINFYTDLRSEELYVNNKRTSLWQIVLYPIGKFIQNYIIRKGILDGMPGLISAVLMSFHSFLVRGKLWLLWKRK